MGVSGCGKTTIGTLLSIETGIKFIDADFYHSKKNKTKMKKGIPLDDLDRSFWLNKINSELIKYSKKNTSKKNDNDKGKNYIEGEYEDIEDKDGK